MPFELIVQSAFTERLDGGAVRIRQAGDHISDPGQVEALRGRPHVVQVWVDEMPPAAPEAPPPAPAPKTPLMPRQAPALSDPAPAPTNV